MHMQKRVHMASTQRKKKTAAHGFALKMITPTVVILAVLTLYPLIFTLIYSFTNYNYLQGADKAKFIALGNYVKILKNTYFQRAMWNTVKFTVLAVFFEMLFGLLLAIFIKSLRWGQKIMRTLVLLPYLLPAVTVALSFRMMLSQNYGIVNQVLTALHLPVYNWFMDKHTAFNMILLIDVWQNVPFVFLLLYASMLSIPKDQYEAAMVDGAGWIRQHIYVTIPNLGSSLALCAMLRVIDRFRLFEKVNILTGGGPAGTTSTITQFLYNNGIKSLKFGYGSAGAIIMTILVLIFSGIYVKKAVS